MLLIFSVLIIATLTVTLTISLSSMRDETRNVLKASLSQRYDTMIKAQVQQAISAMQVEWNRRSDDSEGTEACRKLLRSLRYLDDHSGYFWADTLDGVNQVHGSKPELEGKSRIDSVDSQGFKLIREIFIDRKPEGYAFAGDHPRWTAEETFKRLAPPEG